MHHEEYIMNRNDLETMLEIIDEKNTACVGLNWYYTGQEKNKEKPKTTFINYYNSKYLCILNTVVSGISDSGISNNSAYPTWPFRCLWKELLSLPCIKIRRIRYSAYPTRFLRSLAMSDMPDTTV